MEMTERIKYCRVCKSRKFNNETGIICGLNDKKPDFESNCKSFEEDLEYVKKNKERFDYNPKKWKRFDNQFIESSKSSLKFDLFALEPNIERIELRKERYNKISLACLSGFVIMFIRILTENAEVIDNLKEPINLTFFLGLLVYPIVRYVFPFKTYLLDSEGIQINKERKINWTQVKGLNYSMNLDEEDNTVSTLYFYLILNDYKNIRIDLQNYTFEDQRGLKDKMKEHGIKLNSKELLESIILSFHRKYK